MPIVLSGRGLPRGQSKARQAGETLAWQLSKLDGFTVAREFIFHQVRKWRFDGAIVADRVAFEIEGAIFKGQRERTQLDTMGAAGVSMSAADVKALLGAQGGRHNRGAGMKGDLEKYAEAAAAGWVVIRVMPEWVEDGRARAWIRRAVATRRGEPDPIAAERNGRSTHPPTSHPHRSRT